jgi:dissimilatory sulfite reductase (desulfoviridin) alpha/beta subunit
MRYISYAYEQFYNSAKYLRASERDEEKYGKGYGKYDKQQSDEYIRDSKEYLEKVRKMIKEIEDNLK